MVLINCSVEDGEGYIHLVPAEETEDRPNSLKLLPVARCGHHFMGQATWCRASNAGDVIWKGQAFEPNDLADLIIRLKDDGYMCRECVREHWRAVGGIPGLYHHPWTKDLHREDPHEDAEDDLKPVHASVETEEGITVMHVGEGSIQLNGTCPRCTEPLHVRTHVIKPPDKRRVGVACTKCTWSRDVTLPR